MEAQLGPESAEKSIWQKRAISRLIWHLGLRYTQGTYRKRGGPIPLVTLDLTFDLGVKVNQQK